MGRPRRRRRGRAAAAYLGCHGGRHHPHRRATAMMTPAFDTVETCWVCGGETFDAVHEALFEFSIYAEQDPELAAYSGATVTLQRCRACGFAQPAALPAL